MKINLISILIIIFVLLIIIIAYHYNEKGEYFLAGAFFLLIGLYEFLIGFRKSEWVKTAVKGKLFYYIFGEDVHYFLMLLGFIFAAAGIIFLLK